LPAFFRSFTGKEPVRDWLKEQSKDTKKAIGEDINTIERMCPVGFPLVRKVDKNLWEVRTVLMEGSGRVFFTIWEKLMVLLHGFIKKSPKTPQKDLDTAKKTGILFYLEVWKMVNNAIGSAFESFLEEEGIREEVESGAVKKIIALQMRDRLQADRLTKSELAERLHTSRAAVDRLLDPNNESVTLLTLKKAASIFGKQLRLELV